MATDLRSTSSDGYAAFDEYIEFQLGKTKSNIKWTEIGLGFLWVAIAVLGYLLLFSVFDQWIIPGGFGPIPRAVMLLALVAGTGWAIARHIVLPGMRRIHGLYAAKVIERADPELKSALLNLVDLQRAGQPVPPAVLKAIEKRTAVTLSKFDVDLAVDRRPLLRFSYVLLGVMVLFGLYSLLSPKDVMTSVKRALIPTSLTPAPTQTTITNLTPGETSLPARSSLVVEADVQGKVPEKVLLIYTTADRNVVDERIEMRQVEEGLPRYRGTLLGENGRGLLQNVTYRVEAGDARTVDFEVTVIQPPSARVESVAYAYPTYTQLEPKTVPGGAIDAWDGTTVTITGTSNMPVTSAQVVLLDVEDSHARGEELPVTIIEGTTLKAEWKVGFRSDGTAPRFYVVRVKTAKGETDPDPTLYSVKVRPDLPPEVTLISPAADVSRPANATLPLLIQASDPDFKLRSLTIKALLPNGDKFDQRILEDQTLGASFKGSADLSLGTLKVKPGDKFPLWIEARDNRQPTGNVRSTPRIEVTITEPVTPEQARKQHEQEKKEQEQQANPPKPEEAKPHDAKPENNPENQPEQTKPENQPQEQKPEGERQKQPENGRADGMPGEGDPKDQADQNKEGPGEPGEPRDDRPRPDGEDDERALEKILNREQNRQRPQRQQKSSSDSEQRPPQDNGDPQNTENNNADNAPPPMGTNRTPQKPPPGKPGTQRGQQQPGTNADNKTPPEMPESGMPEPDMPEPMTGGQKANGPSTEKPGTPDSKKPQAGKSEPQKPEAGKPDQRRTGNDPQPEATEKKPGETQDTQPEKNTRPMPNPDDPSSAPQKTGTQKADDQKPGTTSKPEQGKRDSNKPDGTSEPMPMTDVPKPGEGDPMPRPGSNPSPNNDAGKPSEQQPGEQKTDAPKPGESQTDKPSPNRTNPSAEKQSTEKEPGTKQPGTKQPGAQRPGESPMPSEGTKPDPMKTEATKPGQPMSGQPKPQGDQPGEKPDAGRPNGDRREQKPGEATAPMNDKPGMTDDHPQPDAKQDKSGTGKKPEQGEAAGKKDGTPEKPQPGQKGMGGGQKSEDTPGDNPQTDKDPNSKGGTPTDSNTPAGDSQEGEDAKANTQAPKNATKPGRNQGPTPEGAEEKPAEDDGSARDVKATGKEKGMAEGAEKPDPEAVRAENALDKKPGDKGARQPGKPEDKQAQPPRQRNSREGDQAGGSNDPDQARPPAKRNSQEPRPRSEKGIQSDSDPTQNPDRKADKHPNDQPDTGNEELKGDGKRQGQKSNSNDGGEAGSNKPAEKGTTGSNKKGPGDTDTMPGDADPSDKPNSGDSSDQKGNGSKSAPSADGKKPQEGQEQSSKPASQPGETGSNPQASDKGGEQKGSSQPGQQGKPSQQKGGPGEQGGQGQGGDSSPQGKPSEGAGEDYGPRQNRGPGDDRPAGPIGANEPDVDPATALQRNKDASNLVLRRLKEDLESGEVDKDLLKQLGWTEDNLRQFIDRMDQKINDTGDDNSPQGQARRKRFEEFLKSLRVGEKTEKRKAGTRSTRLGPNIQSNTTVPAEYRDQVEAFTRSLSKEKK